MIAGFDKRQEIDRVHFDQCHADYLESLITIRRIGALLNGIIRKLHQEQDSLKNYQRVEALLLQNQEAMKQAINHLVVIEKALNIKNN